MHHIEKACLDRAEEILHAAGFTTTIRRGKHLRLTARSPCGHEGHLTFSSSPRSDLTSQLNFVRQKTQRQIKQLLTGRQSNAGLDTCLTPA